MKYDGTAWVVVGTAGFSAGTAYYNSLALDSAGNPYVAYTDDGNGNEATVMSFPEAATILSGTPSNADVGAHNVDLVVSDGVTTVTHSFTITVANVNDAPVFPDTAFSVAENTAAVGNVLATDIDGDSLVYAKNGGDDAALFAVDATTGALSFNAAPDFETPGDTNADNVYTLTLSANDGEGAAVSAGVTVTVTDANDVISGAFTGEATERSGTQVSGTLIATDEDIGQVGFIAQPSTLGDSSYGTFTLLSNGNWTYDVDNTNSAVLASNDGATLTDTFSAVSSDGTSSQLVTVTINGLNDAPVFTTATIIDFTAIDIANDANGATSVFAIDVDGDGDMDVLSSSFHDNAIAWYENDGNVGNPGFTKRVITNGAAGVYSVFAIDVDGDGDIDVLSASPNDDTIAWYENNGDGDNPSFTKQVITSDADIARSVFAIDVDGDGDIDVLSASYNDDTIAWYENDGNVANPGFTKRVITSVADGAWSVFAIDVDGDGDIDVLSASIEDDTIAWYENDGNVGNPSFTKNIIASDADAAISVFAIDVDDDGDIDVLSASYSDDTIAWYENDGNVVPPGFTKQVITSDAVGAYSVFAIDVDGDGDMDVLSAGAEDDTIAWYENDGNPGFTKRVITTDADGTRMVFAIDVDGDGDIDVLSASLNDNTIAWYENEGTFNFSVPENTTLVANILATDADGDNISYGINGADQALFSIDTNTGALGFINAPDFDAPISANYDNTYNVTVTASANGDVVSSFVVIDVTAFADINPLGTTLIASSAFVDPTPPEGWTQCAGYTNTAGDDVSGAVLDGCLPFSKLRMRLYNDSGVIVDDLYGDGVYVTTFDIRRYIVSTNNCTNVYANFYSFGCLYSGNPWSTQFNPMFTTGGGGPSIIPGNGTHAAEIAVDPWNITSGMIGYTVAVYN
jgi:VCBS repeat-containing protein